ncbi:glycerol uptake operon antiterminator regulatory protein [Paenibacillus radicis (ex Gao et al. 2016)]|uniref:Glycerol uptake operon antiterminator regulatory protein n=1 Tax=Paenibacillus radicis (ex Gao et al. 2016) TaxID=1737354 RepID=A0A917GYK6_9BACL|nr:glycerol uptake operon antiterminator regulatory protein [Paenibacillus radicis (ex Gao et al. 2016)]
MDEVMDGGERWQVSFFGQPIMPSIRGWKDFEALIASSYTYLVLLDSQIGQLKSIVDEASRHGKRILIHADLIEGLKNDEHAAQFLCQQIAPAGIISTRAGVIQKTKQNGLIAIQRLFLLDTNALEKSYAVIERAQPDFIEVLPGVMPHMIREVKEKTGTPVLAGGLIRTADDVEAAIAAGAEAVTTSRRELWKRYAPGQEG